MRRRSEKFGMAGGRATMMLHSTILATPKKAQSLELLLEIPDFQLHQFSNAMIDQVNLHHTHAELAGDLHRGPMPDRIEVEYLKMLRLNTSANSGQRRLE